MRRFQAALLLFAIALASAACNEDGTIKVRTPNFHGGKAVHVSTLKNALATKEDSRLPIVGWRLPWSKPRSYFDRGRFDADLKRIQAFYADRGYPDARVASFDVQPNADQTEVDITLKIDEGAP